MLTRSRMSASSFNRLDQFLSDSVDYATDKLVLSVVRQKQALLLRLIAGCICKNRVQKPCPASFCRKKEDSVRVIEQARPGFVRDREPWTTRAHQRRMDCSLPYSS